LLRAQPESRKRDEKKHAETPHHLPPSSTKSP
jgi:hypothetical protein